MSFNLKKKLAKFFLIDFIWFSLFLVPFAQAQAADNLYFVHSDHLGSNTVITDEKGEAVTQNRYYPYGSDKSSEGDQSLTERKYTSQIKDEETGIYYYNARYYDPALGTFVSPDEVDDSLNRYGYVKNNPILYADPSGNIIITTTAILLGISTVAFYASAVGFGVVAGGIGYDIINDHAYTIPVLNISHEPSASSERLAADTKQLGADILHGAYLAGSIAQAAMPIGQAIDNYMASRASQAEILPTSSFRVYDQTPNHVDHRTMYPHNTYKAPGYINPNSDGARELLNAYNYNMQFREGYQSRIVIAARTVHQIMPYDTSFNVYNNASYALTQNDILLNRGPELFRVVEIAGNGKGVCLHQSMATSWLASMAGKPSFTYITGRQNNMIRHAFNVFYLNNQPYALDVANDILDPYPFNKYMRDFNIGSINYVERYMPR